MAAVPQFAESLAPYIRTRDEALRIRCAFTRHLISQITFVDDSPAPHLVRCDAQNVDCVKDIPLEYGNGLRTQYLKALQRNVAARKQYSAALHDFTALKQEKRSRDIERAPCGKGQELQAYLSLLQARRERERMQVLRHHLGRLNDMEAAQQDYLVSGSEGDRGSPFLPATGSDTGEASDVPVGETVDAIMNNLERAILLVKHRLKVEQKKRDAARALAEQAGKGAGLNVAEASVRLQALSRVRDELIQWAEEKLAAAAADDGKASEDTASTTTGEVDPSSLEDKKIRIRDQYQKYVAARQALLQSVTVASWPLRTEEKRDNAHQGPSTDLSSEFEVLPTAILPYTSKNLLPLSKVQKTVALQRSYATAMLFKETWTTCKVLERLREESQLLDKYSILERQARFKHAVAAISSRRSSLVRKESGEESLSEILKQAEAWEYASAAAADATHDYVDERVALVTELVRNMEDTLRDIYTTMNRDYSGSLTKNGGDQRQGEIARIEASRFRHRRRITMVLEEQDKGPWSGLSGKVGVIGDR
ncbi:hypothetical protein VTO42DRAFT_6631 [Malbranchea cinnamomea]